MRILAVFAVGCLALAAQTERETAEKLMTDARTLAQQKGPEAQHKAGSEFEQAAAIWGSASEPARQIEALEGAAWTHYALQELKEMEALLNRAMDLSGPLKAPGVRAELLVTFAVLHNTRGEFSRAINEYGEARELYRALKSALAEQQVTSFLANSWRMQANAAEKTDIAGAIESHRRAEALYEEAKDPKRAGTEYMRLGQLERQAGTQAAWERSATAFTSALPLLKTAEDRFDTVSTLWGLGGVAGQMKQFARSREALTEALPMLDELKNAKAEGMVVELLADAEKNVGDPAAAAQHYEQAQKLFEQDSSGGMNQFLAGMNLGIMQEALGQREQALTTFKGVTARARSAKNVSQEATGLRATAVLEVGQRNWMAALAALRELQGLHGSVVDKVGEAADLGLMGSVFGSQGLYREKLTVALQALDLLAGGADRHAEAQALSEVGDCYNSLHESQNALKYLGKARAMAAADQMPLVLVEMGEVYYDLTMLDKALPLEREALAAAGSLQSPNFLSRIRNDIALTLQAKGEMKEAGEIFAKNLAEAKQSGNVQGVYSATHNLGKLRQDFGDHQEAARLFEAALAMEQKDGNREQAAITLDALGSTYHALAQDDKALSSLDQSLTEWRTLGDQNGEAISLNNLALIYSDMGRPQQAIDVMEEAVRKRRSLKDDAGVANLLRAMGGIYHTLGDYDRAESYFAAALTAQKQFGDEHAEALTHNSLGVIEIQRQEPAAAMREFEQSMVLLRKFGDRSGEATTLANIANVLIDEGAFGEAETRFRQSLAIARDLKNADLEALSLHGLGSVYEKWGRPEQARHNLVLAAALWRTLHEVSAQSKAYSLLARVDVKQGRLEAALRDCRESIRLQETERGGLGSEDLRAYYQASIASPYRLEVEVMMAMHRAHPGKSWDVHAFEASERSRARSLLEMLTSAKIDPGKGSDPKLTSEDEAARQAISAKAAQLHKLTADSDDYRALQLQVAELTAERERVAAALRKVQGSQTGPGGAAALTVAEIRRQVLDPDSVLLEYSLGENRSYVFVVTAGVFHAFKLPKSAELVQAANDVFADLQKNQADRTEFRKNAAALGRMLLGPVPARLLAGKRLVIVADGELAEIPFGFLPEPGTGSALVASHEVVYLPSASTAAALRAETSHRGKADGEVAVVADPVFEAGDTRAPGRQEAEGARVRGRDLTRLRHSGEEAAAILALAPPSRSLALEGFAASVTNVAGDKLSGYRMVHFATHGLADSAHPQLSGLALSQFDEKGHPVDGFLAMDSIFDMKLKADLVVLSACETGSGKLVGGEGTMSLTRAFLNAGAASVVVSGWSVDDEATSELMERFYAAMLGSGRLRPAAALRSAQQSMIADAKWADPYYWAAFTLQGEWR